MIRNYTKKFIYVFLLIFLSISLFGFTTKNPSWSEVEDTWIYNNPTGENKGYFRKIITDEKTTYYSYLKYIRKNENRVYVTNKADYKYTNPSNHFVDLSEIETSYSFDRPEESFKTLNIFVGNENGDSIIRKKYFNDINKYNEVVRRFQNAPFNKNAKARYEKEEIYQPYNKVFDNVNNLTIRTDLKTWANTYFPYDLFEPSKVYAPNIFFNSELAKENVNYYEVSILVNDKVVYRIDTENISNLNFKASWHDKKQDSGHVETEIDISKLPSTSGNLYNNNGSFGNCFNIEVDKFNKKLKFECLYEGNFYNLKEITFSPEQSLEFLDGVENFIYYTNDNNEHIFIILNSVQSEFSFSTQDMRKWKGQTLWNYERKVISTTNKIDIFIQAHVGVNKNVEFYYFIPDLLIDKVVQIGFNFSYWQKYKNGDLGPKQNVILSIDQNTVFDIIDEDIVRGLNTASTLSKIIGWISLGAGVVVSVISGGTLTPLSGLLIAGGIGFLGIGYGLEEANKTANVNGWFLYSLKALEEKPYVPAIVNSNLSSMIFKKTGKMPKLEGNVRKINLGNTFNAETDIVPDYDSIGFSSLVYNTQGTVYQIDKEYINNHANGPLVFPSPIKPNDSKQNLDLILTVIKWVAIVLIIATGVGLVFKISKFFIGK